MRGWFVFLLALVVALVVLPACSTPKARVVGENAEAGDYAPAIKNEAMWRALAARPSTQHIARSEVVKVIVDKADDSVYFLESKKWPVHFFFAVKYLDKPGHPIPDQAVFNTTEYKSAERRFVLGTVTHYLDADRWVFDLFAGDTLTLEGTAEAFKKIKARVFFAEALAYRPVPPAHERDLDRAKALMPVVTTDEIFGKMRYQPLELGEAFGYLRVIPKGAPFEPRTLRPFDIVVLGDQPEDIPVV